MTRERTLIAAFFVLGLAFLAGNWIIKGGFGRVYVREEAKSFIQVHYSEMNDNGMIEAKLKWLPADSPDLNNPIYIRTGQTLGWKLHPVDLNATSPGNGVTFSWFDTLGIWIAAFLTLAIFSFAYRDNPMYKTAEAVFIGVSAGYQLVINVWDMIVPNLMGNLWPESVRSWAIPGYDPGAAANLWYLVPLVLSVMLLWRLMPEGGWIARWPLALFIGVFAGLKMVSFIKADFLAQLTSAIVPLVVTGTTKQPGDFSAFTASLWNIISFLSLMACLTYFFFSIEHKKVVGGIARFGTWILMITFGAMFGYTVMGRIALLTDRFDFLLRDWLNILR